MSKILVDRAVLGQALDWATEHGDKVFFAGGFQLLHSMNAWAEALRAALEQPQVEQEPYLWHDPVRDQFWNREDAQYMDMSGTIPLYIHPQPPRQPLTDEQIDTMFGNAEIGDALAERVRKRNQEIYWFGVRDAEAAHGIGA